MSPSVERQRSRPRSAPRRTRRRRACVRVGLGREKRKGVEDLYSSCSRKRRRRRLSEKRRPPHLATAIQPLKATLLAPPLAPATPSRFSLPTRAGWAPGRRRRPASRWTFRISRLKFFFLLFCSFASMPRPLLCLFFLSAPARGLSLSHTLTRAPRASCGCCCSTRIERWRVDLRGEVPLKEAIGRRLSLYLLFFLV